MNETLHFHDRALCFLHHLSHPSVAKKITPYIFNTYDTQAALIQVSECKVPNVVQSQV